MMSTEQFRLSNFPIKVQANVSLNEEEGGSGISTSLSSLEGPEAVQQEMTSSLTQLTLVDKPVDDNTRGATIKSPEQGFVVCPSENRFSLLFCFLKRNSKKKIVVFFSSCITAKFHYELLNQNNLCMMHIQAGQDKKDRTTTILRFSHAESGVLLCSNVAARGLDIPVVDWIVQYDPPDDSKEYIHQIAQMARGEGSKANSLLLLRPEELGFLPYLKQAKIPLDEYEASAGSKVADLQLQFEKIVTRNYYLHTLAKEAYEAYLRAYDLHHLKCVFDVYSLDLAKVAKSFGLKMPPSINLRMLGK